MSDNRKEVQWSLVIVDWSVSGKISTIRGDIQSTIMVSTLMRVH